MRWNLQRGTVGFAGTMEMSVVPRRLRTKYLCWILERVANASEAFRLQWLGIRMRNATNASIRITEKIPP